MPRRVKATFRSPAGAEELVVALLVSSLLLLWGAVYSEESLETRAPGGKEPHDSLLAQLFRKEIR